MEIFGYVRKKSTRNSCSNTAKYYLERLVETQVTNFYMELDICLNNELAVLCEVQSHNLSPTYKCLSALLPLISQIKR